MREPHVEGVATHDGPESCVVVRKGEGEALTGVHMGRVLSREIRQSRTPTLLTKAEGNTTGAVIARRQAVLRGRRPLAHVESSCARTGRSPDCPPRMEWRAAPGRPKAGSR
jgi:hypothetical protein